ncbi:hypothetical protein C8R44DRAFT_735702 [Mycena epipterygia]|nr:hypothetical protein C8R44DRAFT_735702 [Mycena epipterygia]
MPDKIAIVGISCELPSGYTSIQNLDHDGFFRFLLSYGEAYEKIPADRFNAESWLGAGPGQISVDTGAFLKDIDLFDNLEFGLSTRDTRAMAPATRKLIEHSFLALLDSGIDYRGRNDEFDALGSFSNQPAMVANKVSYVLNLLGPSLPTDTACSSTATATHLAVQGLLSGDCDAAVVGGCQLNHRPVLGSIPFYAGTHSRLRFIDWIIYSQGSLLAPNGKCKPFDSSADGFSRAEGCVVIVLKRLHDAIRDHDHIYATILSTAINSSGSKAPAGAPVADRQRDVMLEAFRRVNRCPQEVDYVELHATGTAKGDPTETNWVGEHFGRDRELIIGSVKGNIGHTEITAFFASLSKVLSIFQYRVIPPNVNFSTPNPEIEWAKYQLRVPTQPTALPCPPDRTPLISLSSFGIGGANAHVVLEGPPVLLPDGMEMPTQSRNGPVLLMAGGLTPRTASTAAEHITRALPTLPLASRPATAVVFGRRSKQMLWRTYAVVSDADPSVEFPPVTLCPRETSKVVFVFSGQGPQYRDMGRELFDVFPVFRRSVLEMDAIFTNVTQKSLLHHYGLFRSGPAQISDPWPISLILPSITVFQIALYDLLISLNIKPDIVIGHSAGETAVLYASGAAPKAMAVELSIIRGRVFSSVESAGGAMAALSCSAEHAAELISTELSSTPDAVVEVACHNSPSDVAISGHKTALERIVLLAGERGIFARMIRTSVPIHSSMMESCREAYEADVGRLFERFPGPHSPSMRTISTLTGAPWSSTYDAAYFWNNTRGQVLFTSALETITTFSSGLTFIEISPHPVLSGYISTTLGDSASVLCPARRPRSGDLPSEHTELLTFCGRLTMLGHNCVDFAALNGIGSPAAVDVELPTYPFLKKAFPLYPDTPGVVKQMASRRGPLNHDFLRINKSTHPVLAEHVICGEPIMPASGFLEMAIEFGASALMNVNFRSILTLSSATPIRVKVALDGCHWNVSTFSPNKMDLPPTEKIHAEGYLSFERIQSEDEIDIAAIRGRCPEHVGIGRSKISKKALYESLSYFSSYGPRFQRVMSAYYSDREALVSIKGLDKSLETSSEGYILHPAIFDACFHIIGYKYFNGDLNPNTYYLPSSVKTLLIHRPWKHGCFPSLLYAYIKLGSWFPDSMTFDIILADDVGIPLCSLSGLQLDRHRINPLPSVFQPFDIRSQRVTNDMPEDNSVAEISVKPELVEPASIAAEAFRRHLSSIEEPQALRILFSHRAVPMLQTIAPIFAEYSHYYEVHLACRTSVVLSELLGIIRVTPIDLSHCRTDSDEDIGTFDILVDLDGVSLPLACYHRFLRPTGILIMTTARKESVDSNFMGGESTAGMHVSAEYMIQSPEWRCYTLHFNVDDGPHLYNPNSFIFTYTFGDEMALRWDFSGLNVFQKLDIWVFSDHPAALGIARAIRHEYPLWSIRLVLFASSFPIALREEIVQSLPYSFRHEHDFLVSESGALQVPRILPFEQLPEHRKLPSAYPWHDTKKIKHFVRIGGVTGFTAEDEGRDPLGEGNDTGKMHVMGLLLDKAIHDPGDASHFVEISPALLRYQSTTIESVHSLVSAILAVNQTLQLTMLSTVRILLTHADTSYGYFINFFYSVLGHKVTQTSKELRLSQLAALGNQSFDLVISGYQNQEELQILHLLVRPLGRLFLWDCLDEGLSQHMRFSPSLVRSAMDEAVSFLERHIDIYSSPLLAGPSPISTSSSSIYWSASTFGGEATYLVIGGIGHIGAHITLYLYQHGARHITVTSRSGRAGVLKAATFVQRLFAYLDGLSDLCLQYEAVDATSQSEMQALVQRMVVLPRGCFVLTSALSDGTFASLRATDFQSSFTSKISVLETLQRTVDVSSLDFLVAFSSVSGTFGNAGQSAYDATNTALDYMVEKIPNAFSFICPGLLDSSMMLGVKQNRGQLASTLLPWAISTEEMILWLHDALTRYLQGARFHRYLPHLDWETLDNAHGMPLLGRHLVPSNDPNSTALVDNPKGDDAQLSIARIIQQNLNIPSSDFTHSVPLSAYGLDSLSASRISFLLRPFVQISQIQLLADISLNDLLEKVGEPLDTVGNTTIDEPNLPHPASSKEAGLRRWLDILHDISLTLRPDSVQASPASSLNAIVVTGTTGVLGSHILHEILLRNDVRRVYAINRVDRDGRSLLTRQTGAFSDYGLDTSLVRSSKLVLLEGDLESATLGFTGQLKDEIFNSTTHIIHNAWNVNFGPPVVDFDGLLQGTLNLLRLAAESNASFSFISTIAVCQASHYSSPAPEDPIEKFPLRLPSGYLQSKWVAERLVNTASDILGISAKVIRLGLMTGASNGFWDVSHWFPALVESGLHVGCLPDGEGIVSWIPACIAAQAIVDFHGLPHDTLHIVHPCPTTWTSLMTLIAADLDVPLVPYAEWLARLEHAARSSFQTESEKPQIGAFKLLEFYRMASQPSVAQGMVESMGLLPVVAIEKGLPTSASLRNAPLLGRADVGAWMSYWRSVVLAEASWNQNGCLESNQDLCRSTCVHTHP